jgi:hypothetical protein
MPHNAHFCAGSNGFARISERSLWRGRVAHLSMMLPSFVYKITEHRVGRFVLYVILFAAVFAFIVWYLVNQEGGL